MNTDQKPQDIKALQVSAQEKQKRDIIIKKYMKIPTPNTEIKLTLGVIKSLRLLIPLSRKQRRDIARKAGMDWDFYRLIEFEVLKRRKAGVSLETGLPIEEDSAQIEIKGDGK